MQQHQLFTTGNKMGICMLVLMILTCLCLSVEVIGQLPQQWNQNDGGIWRNRYSPSDLYGYSFQTTIRGYKLISSVMNITNGYVLAVVNNQANEQMVLSLSETGDMKVVLKFPPNFPALEDAPLPISDNRCVYTVRKSKSSGGKYVMKSCSNEEQQIMSASQTYASINAIALTQDSLIVVSDNNVLSANKETGNGNWGKYLSELAGPCKVYSEGNNFLVFGPKVAYGFNKDGSIHSTVAGDFYVKGRHEFFTFGSSPYIGTIQKLSNLEHVYVLNIYNKANLAKGVVFTTTLVDKYRHPIELSNCTNIMSATSSPTIVMVCQTIGSNAIAYSFTFDGSSLTKNLEKDLGRPCSNQISAFGNNGWAIACNSVVISYNFDTKSFSQNQVGLPVNRGTQIYGAASRMMLLTVKDTYAIAVEGFGIEN